MQRLDYFDYSVIAVYMLVTIALGLWISRRIHGGRDFFLAGRSLPWWAVGMSLVATDIGGVDIVGVGGQSYAYGLVMGNFEWIGCIPAMILAAFLFIPHFWRCGVTTIPEFLEKRFNAGVRSALAACWLVFMACNLGVMLLVSANMLNEVLGWDIAFSIWMTAAVVGLYTVSGGLAAVVYTDLMQGTVMIGGCLAIVLFGLADIGGIDALQEGLREVEQAQQANPEVADATRPQHLKLILPVDTATPYPWTGILFGLALILSPAYWIGNQAIVQRTLGAKSEFEAKAAYVWGAILKTLIPLIIAVPGLIALVKFPGLTGPETDRALPRLVSELLPSGMRGLFVAAFMAALMSSVDSYLNAAATIFTHDFYLRFIRPTADDLKLLRIGRLTTVILLGWAIAFAFQLAKLDKGIYTIFQTMMAIFQGPALAVLMMGLLWKRATGPAAMAGFLAGVTAAIFLYLTTWESFLNRLGWQPLFQVKEPFLYFSVWAFLVAMSVVVTLSFFTKPDPLEKQAFVISRSSKKVRP